MDNEHIQPLIPDYVLGLLAAEAQQRVEQHARQCAACREAIRRERQVETLLRQTVQTAARPQPGRLERLRPAAPRRADLLRAQFNRRLAPVTLIALLIVLGLLAQVGGWRTFEPAFAQTASAPTQTSTSTHTPTATLAAVDEDTLARTPAATQRAALAAPQPPRPTEPLPAATPIITYTTP